MTKKPSVISRRAWRLLRLALLWARKGGLFHIIHKVVRKLGNSGESRGALAYGDHEFSFDETPIVRVKMHRPCSYSLPKFKMPHFPCIGPQVDFDYDFGEDESDHVRGACGDDVDDEGIDVKAEKFIADFYEQMKRQNQISST